MDKGLRNQLFSKDFIKELNNPPLDFSFDVYVLFKALKKEMKIITFDVDFGVREHGKSKWASTFLSKYKTIINYIINIFKIAFIEKLKK